MADRLKGVREIAAYSGLGVDATRALLRSGRIKSVRLNGVYIARPEDVDALFMSLGELPLPAGPRIGQPEARA
jgi:hypothetical protein